MYTFFEFEEDIFAKISETHIKGGFEVNKIIMYTIFQYQSSSLSTSIECILIFISILICFSWVHLLLCRTWI